VGDIVTFHSAGGTVVTHRIVAKQATADVTLQTKGDANQVADTTPVTTENVIGRVEFIMPVAGAVLLTLSSTSGAVLTLGMLGALLVSIWFMDELLASVRRSATRRQALTEPAA
jgi:signal peptidase I